MEERTQFFTWHWNIFFHTGYIYIFSIFLALCWLFLSSYISPNTRLNIAGIWCIRVKETHPFVTRYPGNAFDIQYEKFKVSIREYKDTQTKKQEVSCLTLLLFLYVLDSIFNLHYFSIFWFNMYASGRKNETKFWSWCIYSMCKN